MQGRRSDGEDFLVTLPVDLWSRCTVGVERLDGQSRVLATLPKSLRVAEHLLSGLGPQLGVRLRVEIERDIPIGKGLSSSTADMLAVLRACEMLFGVRIADSCISRLFTAIEPHDALHYPGCVAYNHRRGRLLDRFDYVPDYRIIAVDAGGQVCTERYNRNLAFSTSLMAHYDRLYRTTAQAFAARDDLAIARCARQATELHAQRIGSAFLSGLLELADRADVLGIVTAHSGTCAGLLLSGDADASRVRRLRAALAPLDSLFETRTLSSSRHEAQWPDGRDRLQF